MPYREQQAALDYLTSHRQELTIKLSSFLTPSRCSQCGETVSEYNMWRNPDVTLCIPCDSQFAHCSHCGRPLLSPGHALSATEQVCDACFGLYAECPICHRLHRRSGMEYATYHGEPQQICYDCLDAAPRCVFCGAFTFDAALENEAGDVVCENCATNLAVFTCQSCGGFRMARDTYCHTDGGHYCFDCADELGFCIREPIKRYGYKPRPKFKPAPAPGGLFFGIELEVDGAGEDIDSARRTIEELGYVYCKHDGSLHEGYEIVTHPATVEYHLQTMQRQWKSVMKRLHAEGFRSGDCNSCGLHVHVSREPIGEANVAKILYLFERFWPQFVTLSRRSGRELERWARRYDEHGEYQCPDSLAKLKGKADDISHCHDGHYFAVNLGNTSTVEFRMFKGTLNFHTFCATLQLVDTVVRKAMAIPNSELQTITFEELLQSDYPELAQYIGERNRGVTRRDAGSTAARYPSRATRSTILQAC